MRLRIALITKSYGRLIDFLIGTYFLDSKKDSTKTSKVSATKTMWFFPEKHMYPFISSLLEKKGLKISESSYLGLIYRLLTRIKFSLLIDSTSHYDYQFYETAHEAIGTDCGGGKDQDFRTSLQRDIRKTFNASDIKLIHPFLAEITETNKKLCLLYSRNEDWDVRHYGTTSRVHSNELHRNQQLDLTDCIVDILKDRNYLVARIGRDSRFYEETPYFFDYASKQFASDEIDFFLWSKASCLISSSGGADTPRMIFGTPTLFLDPKEPFGNLLANDRMSPTFILPPVFFDGSEIASLEELSESGYLPDSMRKINSLRNFKFRIEENSKANVSAVINEFISVQNQASRDVSLSKFVKLNGFLVSKNWPNLNP